MNISFSKGKAKTKTKPFKIKTTIFQRIGRVILWTLIILLILRGVSTFFITSETGEAEKLINEFIRESSYREKVEREAASFAERFSREYLTSNKSDINDYEKRLREFMPNYVSIEGRNYGGNKMTVISSSAYKVEWFRKHQVNVYVSAKVLYEQDIKEGEEVIKEQREKEVHLLVPVSEKEGKYAVEDLPAIVPTPRKAEISASHYPGNNLDTNISKEIQEVLESFFKTFYSGNAGEISYYMYQNNDLYGFEGRYKFNRIEGIRSFEGKEENEYFAIVHLNIEDDISKIQFKQGYNITLIKKDSRYYIKDFNIRTVNLHETEEEI